MNVGSKRLTFTPRSTPNAMTLLAGFAALIMGFVLGLLGGGGSILAVPILVYLLGVAPKAAIATSLLVVGSTAAVAVIGHARTGNVAWRTGLIFGVFAMAGAFGGGAVAQFIPGTVLLIIFAALMLVTAVAMLRGKPSNVEAKERTELPIAKVALEGVVVGGVTGLVGAGGGFLVVPALVLLGGLSMKRAIGTSLLVIALKAFAGFAGYAAHAEIDYTLAAGFIGVALLGSLLGSTAARYVPGEKLRTAFAVFVLVMGGGILAQETGASLAWVAGVAGVAAAGVGIAWLLRRNDRNGGKRGAAVSAAPERRSESSVVRDIAPSEA